VAVTLVQIAERMGLSPATVSLAIRNKNAGMKRLCPKTVARVQRVAKEMGYRPNGVASSLVSNKSNTIGILTQLSQIGTKIGGFDSASGVSFHHKTHHLAGSYISSAAAVWANPS